MPVDYVLHFQLAASFKSLLSHNLSLKQPMEEGPGQVTNATGLGSMGPRFRGLIKKIRVLIIYKVETVSIEYLKLRFRPL